MPSLDTTSSGGTQGGVALGAHATDPETATLIFWARHGATALQNRALFSQRDATTGAGFCDVGGGTAANEFCARINYATKDAQAYTSVAALTVNKWYYWAVTLDGTNSAPRIFYGDAHTHVVEATYAGAPTRQAGAGARTTDGGATAYCGQNIYQFGVNGRGQWTGRVAFFAWYDTILTDKQIAAHRLITYNWLQSARQMIRFGLQGAVAADISGNKRNGTLGAGTVVASSANIPQGRGQYR